MDNKLLKSIFYIFFSFIITSSIFSQDFYRIIELKNPRMNGLDVLELQKRLLKLTFYELGEADGYYGPMTEDVVKKIQRFSGFESDGKINRVLWDYIFNDGNESLLKNVGVVLLYDITKFIKTNEHIDTGDHFYSSSFIYYSSIDQKVKILVSKDAGEQVINFNTFYYISDNFYFIHHISSYAGVEEDMEILLVDNNKYYKIIDGDLQNFNDGGRISYFEHINSYKNILIEENM